MANSFFFLLALMLLLLISLTPTSSLAILNSSTTEQNALLAFKDGITSDPSGVLTTWSANASVCRWTGVSCGLKHQRVTALNLSRLNLQGTIAPHLKNLTFLRSLDISSNSFTGGIPPPLFSISRLQTLKMASNKLTGQLPNDICSGNALRLRLLNLSNNQLDGQIPVGMYKCAKLEYLSLSINNFTGNIPTQIGNFTTLKTLSLFSNNLRGPIPKQLGNLTSLVQLRISSNMLTGELPEEIGNLAYLEIFIAGFNNLSGPIPPSIFNVSTLKVLALQQNQFSGSLPLTMGLSLINLQELYLFLNKLSGEIPRSITNASQLTMLELNRNAFNGFIPDFGNLRFLKALRLWENNLSGSESPTKELRFLSSLTDCTDLKFLEFSDNPLMNGVLPASIGNLSTSLVTFWAYNCNIRGVIPSRIGNLSSLQKLDLSGNQLTGFIPTTIGDLKKLVELYLYGNQLRGYIPLELCELGKLDSLDLSVNILTSSIPECLGKIKSLREVSFDSNKLDSTLPSKFFNLVDLTFLNLSSNYLSGQLPIQIGSLKHVSKLDLSHNNFSGNIPSSIDGCESLQILYLSNNMLNGSIPKSMGDVKALNRLDLSNNGLSGFIPPSLEKLDLQYFNASYNHLEGEIPDKGCFTRFNAQSFLHNLGLCGASRFQVRACKYSRRSKSKTVSLVMKYILPPFVAFMILVAGIIVLIRKRSKKNKPPADEEVPTVPTAWKKFSERELQQGTSSFSDTNLLGIGSIGSVYRATLPGGDVAVKVFNLQVEGATKIFETESQILGAIRHRNLLKVIGCCSNNEFKALILSYMPNGSLDKWLHSDKHYLDLVERLKIAIDVALGLEYLHHGHTNTVVHCDIKPSNVLLDEDMTARVGDFGIAKLFDIGMDEVQTRSMATIGYAAPEFGEGRISTKGDVYSYGILLLEMFTSKRPTDDMFDADLSIKAWVEKALQENRTGEVVAPGLISREDEHFAAKTLQSVSSIFELAMKCLFISAQERIDMMEVVADLQKIKMPLQEVKKHRG